MSVVVEPDRRRRFTHGDRRWLDGSTGIPGRVLFVVLEVELSPGMTVWSWLL